MSSRLHVFFNDIVRGEIVQRVVANAHVDEALEELQHGADLVRGTMNLYIQS